MADAHAAAPGTAAASEADAATQSTADGSGPLAAKARLQVAMRSAFAELRAQKEHLRQLALNQQALIAHYTQQLALVSHAQAEITLRHHRESRKRYKQLKIVRRETTRLCRSLEIAEGEKRSGQRKSDAGATPQRADAALLLMAHVQASSRAAGMANGGGRTHSANGHAVAAGHAGGIAANAPGGAAGQCGSSRAASAGRSAPPVPRPTSGGAPAQLHALVSQACGHALRSLEKPSSATAGAGSGTSRAGRPTSARAGGVASTTQAAYAPLPPPAGTGAKTARGMLTRHGGDAAAEAGRTDAAAAAGGAPTALRQPAVQQALAEALWQLMIDHSGSPAALSPDGELRPGSAKPVGHRPHGAAFFH